MHDFNEVEVLLAEDSKTDKELILRVLKNHDITDKVFAVKNGEEALEYVFAYGQYANRDKNLFPRAILLDLKLPKVNGIDVLKEIKSNEQTKSIPIIIFTSSNNEKDKDESYSLGANSYVIKPINSEAFIQAILEIGHYWLFLNQ